MGVTPVAGFNPLVENQSRRNEIFFKERGDLFVGKLKNSIVNFVIVEGKINDASMIVRERWNSTSGGTIFICAPNDRIKEITRISLYLKWTSLNYPIKVIWDNQKGHTMPITVFPIMVNDSSGMESYLHSFAIPGPGLIHIIFDKGNLLSKSSNNLPISSISLQSNVFYWTIIAPFLLLVMSLIASRISFSKRRKRGLC